MREVFASIIPWATVVFAVSSMLAVGLASTFSGIVGPLRNWPRVIRALAANFALSPTLAILLARSLDLDLPLRIGLFVTGAAAGSPFLLKLAGAAESDQPFAASLLVLLLPLTVVFLPIALPTVIPAAEVSAAAIARPLVYSMLLPLTLGLLLRPRAPRFASRMQPLLARLSTVSLALLLLSILVADWQAIVGLGARAVFAAVCFLVGSLAIGWTLGGRFRETRNVIALGTAQRNIGAATIVATQAFAELPGVVVMITGTAVIGLLLLFPVAFTMRARKAPAPRRILRRREA